MFTLEVHHGGYFADGLYMGGIVQWIDGQDADEVSMLELFEMVKHLGYDEQNIQYYYKHRTNGWVEIRTDKDYFGALKLMKPRQLFVLYITANPAPRPLNVESPVFSANAEHHEDTVPGYDADEENVQYEFVDVEIEEEFGEAEEGGEAEEVEVESDEAEGGEDDEEDGDFIDSEFEQSDEEDNMNFQRYVVSEEQDDGNQEPGEGDTGGYNTSDLESLHEDSEGEDVKKKGLRQPKFKQYNKHHDLLDPKFHLGLEFPNMQECREAIKYYACKCARRIRYVKNKPNRVRLVCDGKGEKAKKQSDKSKRTGKGEEGEDESADKLEDCPWLLYAAHVGKGPTVRVKTFHPIHTCGRSQRTKFATSHWLAKRFDEDLRTNPNMSVADFMALVRKHYSIDVTRDQCYKAKNFARERIQGSIEEQYAKLWDYCEELKRQNPGSTVLVKTSLRGDGPVFERLYICFAQLRKGFIEGCRTMVGFDGAFIKGQHPGQLLSAVGIDANNGMFPIAFAVVEIENRDTWTWFLDIFFNDVGVRGTGNGWVFITDKQKGLGQTIEALKPDAEHRHCVRHLHNNFKVAGHGSLSLKQKLWAAARSTTLPWWEAEMDNIMEISAPAHAWLKDRPAIHWSRSHFTTGSKCDILLNNLCECFNSAILEARDKPIITMVERIRTYLMLRVARQKEVKCPQRVGPRIFQIIEFFLKESGSCIAQNAGGNKFQVTYMLDGQYAVDLNTHSCSCRKWDLCGIPCCHAMAAISRQQRSPMSYVNKVYKREAYDRAYSNYISPMPSQTLWRKSGHAPIKPPLYHKQSGRPKKARTRPVDDIPKGATKLRRYGIVIHCSICGGEGHNATNCGRADGRRGRGRGRGTGRRKCVGRGTGATATLQEIRGGLTRTAATASQTAPTNVASQASGTNLASQPGPSSQPRPSSQPESAITTQNSSRPGGKRFKSPAKRARPWR